MTFHNVLFPIEISYGSQGGPKFSTTIVTLASGKERRNINWRDVRAEYDVAHGIKDASAMEDLREFFYARWGRAYSFRFFDHADHVIIDQDIGVATASQTVFQFVKTYTSGANSYTRNITKLKTDTLEDILDNGVAVPEDDYVVDYDNGTVTFDTGRTVGHVINCPYVEFDVHARFDTDHFDPVHEFWLTESWQSIPVVEIKD